MQTSEKVSEFDDALFSETPFTIFSETPFTIFVMILQPIVNVQLLPIANVLPCDYTPALAGVLSLLSLAGKICPRAVPASYGLALVPSKYSGQLADRRARPEHGNNIAFRGGLIIV
jgi:hypothetical protein